MLRLTLDFRIDKDNIKQICREYWDCNENGAFSLTVAQIAKNHGLKTADVTTIAYDGCDAYSADYVCIRCKDPFIFSNRTEYMQAFRHPTRAGLCSECREKEAAAIKAKQEAETQAQRDSIREHYDLRSFDELDIHDLSLEDAVFLMSFVRAMYTEDLTVYGPADNSIFRLAPTIKFSSEIMRSLYRNPKHLIRVHPDSPIDAFEFTDGVPNQFHISKVKWALMTGDSSEETRKFIKAIQNTFENPELRPFDWTSQILPLWRKIAFYECLEYLEKVLREYHFPFNHGEKTHLVISTLLEYRSVSEVYNFILVAVRNAASFQKKHNISNTHAANTVPGNIQTYSERARVEGWERKRYKRDFDCPQTVVSKVFFDLVLRIGDAGFDEVPHAIIVKNSSESQGELSAEEQFELGEQ